VSFDPPIGIEPRLIRRTRRCLLVNVPPTHVPFSLRSGDHGMQSCVAPMSASSAQATPRSVAQRCARYLNGFRWRPALTHTYHVVWPRCAAHAVRRHRQDAGRTTIDCNRALRTGAIRDLRHPRSWALVGAPALFSHNWKPAEKIGYRDMMIHRRACLIWLLLSIMTASACASDDRDADASELHLASGNGGAGRAVAGGGGTAALASTAGRGGSIGSAGKTGTAGRGGSIGSAGKTGTPAGPQPVPCGSTTCNLDPLLASFLDACCVDPSQGICGTSMGGACMAPAASDPRCPAVNVGAFMLPSCCTVGGQCGIDASMFGMGCIAIADAGSMASGGFGLFPAPSACDRGSDDAGVSDAGT
jgi:hypothetical protein